MPYLPIWKFRRMGAGARGVVDKWIVSGSTSCWRERQKSPSQSV